MKKLVLLVFLGGLWSPAVFSGFEGVFDQRIQTPELAAPVRGSLAGDLSGEMGTDLAKGLFHVPIGLHFPNERGSLIFSIEPSYSPSAGLSEWGLGISNSLSIHRYRVTGSLDFQSDDLMSPWGHLVKGADGFYYPLGLNQRVRIKMYSEEEIHAFLPDGRVLIFGREQVIQTPQGIYRWYLVEAKNQVQQTSFYHYRRSEQNFLYLDEVIYGGTPGNSQYQVRIEYEPLKLPFIDFRSTVRQELNERVRTVHVLVRTTQSGYHERYQYRFKYEDAEFGPAFYLASIQKIYASGTSEPARSFSYNTRDEFLSKNRWNTVEWLKGPLQKFKNGFLDYQRASFLDPDLEGLTSIEVPYEDYAVVRNLGHGQGTIEYLPKRDRETNTWCRNPSLRVAAPRNLIRLRGIQSELEVAFIYWDSSRGHTPFLVCSRDGKLKQQLVLPGNWALGPKTKLADLSRSGKPDLIRVVGNKYQILRNISTSEKIEFDSHVIEGSLGENLRLGEEPEAILIQDLNGDGIPDLVGKYSHAFGVWYGKGNFSFESERKMLPVQDSSGQPLRMGKDIQIYFQDLNGDGIADLLLYSFGNFKILYSNGRGFAQKKIAALNPDQLPVNTNIQRYVVPVLGDFFGSGNLQMLISTWTDSWALELTQPQTGLLQSVDDGKGNRLQFEYTRAKAEPGIGTRLPVLSRVVTSRTGVSESVFHYDYSGSQTHSLNLSLLGFKEVRSGNAFEKSDARFHQEDRIPSLLISKSLEDLRVPDLVKFENKSYEPSEYQGIPYLQLQSEADSFTTTTFSQWLSLERQFIGYQEDLCPTQTIKKTRSYTLQTETQYLKPDLLSANLMCLPHWMTMIGKHPDSSFDFQHRLQIKREAHGLPTELFSSEEEGRILQTIQYNDQLQISSIHQPEKGTTRFGYDHFTRLNQVTQSDGVIIQAQEIDPLTDQIRGLVTLHGPAASHAYRQGFDYDLHERLNKEWNSLYPSSVTNPLAEYDYHYATPDRPAWIAASEKLDPSQDLSSKKTVEFQTAHGKILGRAHRAEQGWTLKDRARYYADSRQSDMLMSQVFEGNPQDISIQELLASGDVVRQDIQSVFGIPLFEQVLYQAKTSGEKTTRPVLTEEGLLLSRIENRLFSTARLQNIEGQILRSINEEGYSHTYQYDALGRLVKMILPDVSTHSVRYDGQGRIIEQKRSDLSAIRYRYQPGTELVAEKTYWGRIEKDLPDQRISYTYDHAGRVVSERYGEGFEFRYRYDGKLSDHQVILGQSGFLTRVEGPGFTKDMSYHPDGKLSHLVLDLNSSGRMTKSLEYFTDGTIKNQRIQIEGLAQAEARKYSESYHLDLFGRIGSIDYEPGLKAALSYTPHSKLESIGLGPFGKYQLQYDSMTQQTSGKAFVRGSKGYKTRWDFDRRGQIEAEHFQLDQEKFSKRYQYTPLGQLLREDASKQHLSYSYDNVGKLTHFGERAEKEIRSSSSQWTVKNPSPIDYELDNLGRVTRTPHGRTEYGPNGRIFRWIPYDKGNQADGTIQYGYDETGRRLFKRKGAELSEVYFDDLVITPEHTYRPVQVSGILLGVFEDEHFIPLKSDMRGTLIAESREKPYLASAYGERTKERTGYSKAIDYALQGYDADLKAYRMAARDYDPVLKRFLTPDPFFFENPEKCIDSPLECNLYSYAKGNPVSFVDPTGLTVVGVGTQFGANVFGMSVNLSGSLLLGYDRSLGISSGFNISGGMGPGTGLGISLGGVTTISGDKAVTTNFVQTESRGGSGTLYLGISVDHVKSTGRDGTITSDMSFGITRGGGFEMHEQRGFSQTYTWSDAIDFFKSAVGIGTSNSPDKSGNSSATQIDGWLNNPNSSSKDNFGFGL